MKLGTRLGVVALLGLVGRPAVAQPKHDPSPAIGGEVVERSRLEVQPGLHAFNQLAIENPLGNVRVEGYDGTAIQIETYKHAPDDDALDRLRVSLVPSSDGTVRITTSVDGGKEYRPVARGAVRIDLIIRAPRNTRVDAAVCDRQARAREHGRRRRARQRLGIDLGQEPAGRGARRTASPG